MSYLGRITFNPEQCGGRPCIRGMRIRVKDVLDLLAAGVSEKEILEDYPDLEAEDIKACLQYRPQLKPTMRSLGCRGIRCRRSAAACRGGLFCCCLDLRCCANTFGHNELKVAFHRHSCLRLLRVGRAQVAMNSLLTATFETAS